MLNKDSVLLEKAYLAIKSPLVQTPSDEKEENEVTLTREENPMVSTDPVVEPAPSGEPMVSVGSAATTEPTATMTEPSMSEPSMTDGSCSCGEEENEEHEMTLDNLNSIRESIMKIAAYCGSGQGLEPWQQQKLAIAMDNLAGVARALSSGARC